MAYDNQKLLRFKETVLKNVEFEIIKMKEKITHHERSELENSKNKKLDELFNSMQKEVKNIKSSFNQKLSKKTLESKNEILIFRNSLIEKFKKSCKSALQNFTQTLDYKDYLIDSIKNSFKKLASNEETILKLKRTDLKFKNKILTIAVFNSVEADDSIELGGFKIVLIKQKMLIDRTLTTLLESELKKFSKNYKKALDISKEG